MRFLLDTHLLRWVADSPSRPSGEVHAAKFDPDNEIVFSVFSIWELAIKVGRKRPGFRVDVAKLRRQLLGGEYRELLVTSEQALVVADLPPLHKDPFDRWLLAQAMTEGLTLITKYRLVGRCPRPIWLV